MTRRRPPSTGAAAASDDLELLLKTEERLAGELRASVEAAAETVRAAREEASRIRRESAEALEQELAAHAGRAAEARTAALAALRLEEDRRMARLMASDVDALATWTVEQLLLLPESSP